MCRTLEVTVDIEEKGGKVIKYAYKANKLPGDIDPDGCKTEASTNRQTCNILSKSHSDQQLNQ